MLHSPRKRRAFTLIELLVVVAIIALLVSILVPALKDANELAKTSVCLSNLRQVALASMLYAMDNKDRLPPQPGYGPRGSEYWWMLIERDYLNNSPGPLWTCPAATVGYWSWPEWEQAPLPWQWPWGGWVTPPSHCEPATAKTYGINVRLFWGMEIRRDVNLADMVDPTSTFLHVDSQGATWIDEKFELSDLGLFFGSDRAYAHITGTTFVFLDQHAEFLHDDDIPETWEDPLFWWGTR